uniref:MHC class II beta chain N-terminal domain-containing protein n=1 Tax=Amphilophus citrinellus TaxID=61819 RepID=A0A3Q0SBI2_AMPCI
SDFSIICLSATLSIQTRRNRCVFNSTDPKDIELIASWYYNKMEVNRFTSSAGKFVGYTEYGVKNADFWNNGPFLNTMRAEKERFCQHNIGIWYSNVLSKSVQPTVRLHSSTPSSGHHPAMLVCSANLCNGSVQRTQLGFDSCLTHHPCPV